MLLEQDLHQKKVQIARDFQRHEKGLLKYIGWLMLYKGNEDRTDNAEDILGDTKIRLMYPSAVRRYPNREDYTSDTHYLRFGYKVSHAL
jgi:hypothetical protein